METTRDCAGIRSQLGVYLIGAIAPQDRAAVARHLAACEPCREELSGLAGLPGLLRRPSVQDAAERDGGSSEVSRAQQASRARVAGGTLRDIARRRLWRRWLVAGAVALLAAVAVVGWVPRLTGTAANGREVAVTVLETERVGPATVLTDAEGYTLYWYSSDSTGASNCTGSCATSWPPVSGPAIAGDGVTGELGAVVRADGSLQATYDGHPLYTASTDMLPGQAKGNDVRDSGGVWHEVIVSGPAAPAPGSPRDSDGDGY